MSRQHAIVHHGSVPYVHTHRLSSDARKQLWQSMQQHRAELVDLLQNDAFFKELKDRFNGEVCIPLSEYRELMKKETPTTERTENTEGNAA